MGSDNNKASSLGPLPPISQVPSTITAWEEDGGESDDGRGDVTYESLLATTTESASPSTHSSKVGEDILDSHLDVLQKTIASVGLSKEDMQDLQDTVVPLASALIDISEKTGDRAKAMRAHAVLSEVSHMGIWSVEGI